MSSGLHPDHFFVDLLMARHRQTNVGNGIALRQ